jgi:hypothetical protein
MIGLRAEYTWSRGAPVQEGNRIFRPKWQDGWWLDDGAVNRPASRDNTAAAGNPLRPCRLDEAQFAGAILRGTIIFRECRSPSTVNW